MPNIVDAFSSTCWWKRISPINTYYTRCIWGWLLRAPHPKGTFPMTMCAPPCQFSRLLSALEHHDSTLKVHSSQVWLPTFVWFFFVSVKVMHQFFVASKMMSRKFSVERTGNRKFPPIWSRFSPADRLVVVLVLAPNSPGKSRLSWMLASTQISFRIQRDEVELLFFCMARNPLLSHICHH